MAWASFTFITRWGALERGYRRPYAKLALRLKFAFYPLLAIAALAWLGWDWSHARNLAAAEDAIFDTVIGLRPSESLPSGRVAEVALYDCSVESFHGKGDGGLPWALHIANASCGERVCRYVMGPGLDEAFINNHPIH